MEKWPLLQNLCFQVERFSWDRYFSKFSTYSGQKIPPHTINKKSTHPPIGITTQLQNALTTIIAFCAAGKKLCLIARGLVYHHLIQSLPQLKLEKNIEVQWSGFAIIYKNGASPPKFTGYLRLRFSKCTSLNWPWCPLDTAWHINEPIF